MSTTKASTIRMFGALHTFRKEHNLESKVEMTIPEAGWTARDLAQRLELPMNKIQGVFINHRAHSLAHPVHSGDRIAFIPKGIPTPDLLLLGIYGAI